MDIGLVYHVHYLSFWGLFLYNRYYNVLTVLFSFTSLQSCFLTEATIMILLPLVSVFKIVILQNDQ